MGKILLAVEPGAQSQTVINAASRLAIRSHADLLVLSVREREFTRGLVWDRKPLGDVAELINSAMYQLQRLGLRARGAIRAAPSGRVAEEIALVAGEQGVDVIVVGDPGRLHLRGLVFGSVSHRLMRLSDIPVLVVPAGPATSRSRGRSDSHARAGSGSRPGGWGPLPA